MSYLIFDNHGTFNQWTVNVDAQFGLPRGRTQRYARKLVHPVSNDWACVFDVSSGVQPPAGAVIVEQNHMYENGWFTDNRLE